MHWALTKRIDQFILSQEGSAHVLSAVRCIKPNDNKMPAVFTDGLVRAQVRYLGLLENVQVRRAGYAFRQTYEPCLERYKILCKETWPHWKGSAR